MPARRDGGPVHEKDGAARARGAGRRAREGRCRAREKGGAARARREAGGRVLRSTALVLGSLIHFFASILRASAPASRAASTPPSRRASTPASRRASTPASRGASTPALGRATRIASRMASQTELASTKGSYHEGDLPRRGMSREGEGGGSEGGVMGEGNCTRRR